MLLGALRVCKQFTNTGKASGKLTRELASDASDRKRILCSRPYFWLLGESFQQLVSAVPDTNKLSFLLDNPRDIIIFNVELL